MTRTRTWIACAIALGACGPPPPPDPPMDPVPADPVPADPVPADPVPADPAAAICQPGDQPRLTIVTGDLPDGCTGGDYTIDGMAQGHYPVACAPAPAGVHIVGVQSRGDCAGMGDCELLFEAGRETVHDLRAPACRRRAQAPPPDPVATCTARYRRGFNVDLGRGVEALRLVRNPHWGTATSLNSYGNPCSPLGAGWRVAMGSYDQGFLARVRALPDPDLADALARCPVTYQHVDTVCAPCVHGSVHCPCARRDVSDWIFCTR